MMKNAKDKASTGLSKAGTAIASVKFTRKISNNMKW